MRTSVAALAAWAIGVGALFLITTPCANGASVGAGIARRAVTTQQAQCKSQCQSRYPVTCAQEGTVTMDSNELLVSCWTSECAQRCRPVCHARAEAEASDPGQRHFEYFSCLSEKMVADNYCGADVIVVPTPTAAAAAPSPSAATSATATPFAYSACERGCRDTHWSPALLNPDDPSVGSAYYDCMGDCHPNTARACRMYTSYDGSADEYRQYYTCMQAADQSHYAGVQCLQPNTWKDGRSVGYCQSARDRYVNGTECAGDAVRPADQRRYLDAMGDCSDDLSHFCRTLTDDVLHMAAPLKLDVYYMCLDEVTTDDHFCVNFELARPNKTIPLPAEPVSPVVPVPVPRPCAVGEGDDCWCTVGVLVAALCLTVFVVLIVLFIIYFCVINSGDHGKRGQNAVRPGSGAEEDKSARDTGRKVKGMSRPQLKAFIADTEDDVVELKNKIAKVKRKLKRRGDAAGSSDDEASGGGGRGGGHRGREQQREQKTKKRGSRPSSRSSQRGSSARSSAAAYDDSDNETHVSFGSTSFSHELKRSDYRYDASRSSSRSSLRRS